MVLVVGLQFYRRTTLEQLYMGAMDPAWHQTMFATSVFGAFCVTIVITGFVSVVSSRRVDACYNACLPRGVFGPSGTVATGPP